MLKNKLSLRNLLLFPPIIFAVAALFLSLGMVFFSARQALDRTVQKIAEETGKNVVNRLQSLMNQPFLLNEVNASALESGILNLQDTGARDRFFALQMLKFPEVSYSFYGQEDRSFYGARRDESNRVEVIHNSLSETGGNSRYFATDSAGNPLFATLEVPNFDCRTRPWYKAAAAVGDQVYSPVYQHFVYKDLAITAARPVYTPDGRLHGVLGVDFRLDRINELLKLLVPMPGAEIILLDTQTGEFIGSSSGLENYVLKDGGLKRLTLGDRSDSKNRSIEALRQESRKTALEHRWVGTFTDDGQKYHLEGVRFQGKTLNWEVLVTVPEKELTSGVYDTLFWSGLLSGILVLAFTLNILLVTLQVLKPMNQVVFASRELSQGRWNYPMPQGTYRELVALTAAFNHMAQQLRGSIEGLESTVQERTREIAAKNKELEAANRTKDRFFHLLAHDLRGPMGALHQILKDLSIGSYCEDEESQKALFHDLSQASGNVFSLMENLLNWAASQRNMIDINLESLDLTGAVKETWDVLKPQADEKNISLRFAEAGPQLAWADTQMLKTILRNLISNAIKFTPSGGHIDVTILSEFQVRKVRVRDSGVGIPDSLRTGLFDPSVKTHTSGTSGESGTGLGLTLSWEFARKMGGDLLLVDSGPQGSEFELSLPLPPNLFPL